ncbi:MAG: RluA family pseudouridine synthase [Leptospiraceae bacterium]|nr:RluA family pseudouridine synthase [Leptospiraceae bacterium]
MVMQLEFTVEEEYNNFRLDHFLNSKTGDEISRTSIQKWIKSGNIVKLEVNESLKPNYKVSTGESFLLTIPPRPKFSLEPIDMKIPIIFEDKDLIVIDKPQGIASHGGPEDYRPSLVNGLLYHFKELSNVNNEERPGIVHRLDKQTSGLMLIAKNDFTHIALSKQFQERTIQKIYYAWLVQAPNEREGIIEAAIQRHPKERLKMQVNPKGRKAITVYEIKRTISSRKGRLFSLAEIQIKTGRTHQIRVHFQYKNCPIVGDKLYSRSASEFEKFGLMLFSHKIGFIHPRTREKMQFVLPFPERFEKFEKEAIFY